MSASSGAAALPTPDPVEIDWEVRDEVDVFGLGYTLHRAWVLPQTTVLPLELRVEAEVDGGVRWWIGTDQGTRAEGSAGGAS